MSLKIDHINRAYSQLRISGVTVQPTPQHIELALIHLEDMMIELEDNRNLCVGYNFEDFPEVNSESGVDRNVNQMIKTNLAIRMIPDFNKDVPPALYAQASQSLSALSLFVSQRDVREVQPSQRMPLGSGHRYYNRYQRFMRPDDRAKNQCATIKIEVGEINEYEESYHGYLKSEKIASYEIKIDHGLELLSSSIDDDTVFYRVKALTVSHTRHPIYIIITTDTGRVEIRTIQFEITGELLTVQTVSLPVGCTTTSSVSGVAVSGCSINGTN